MGGGCIYLVQVSSDNEYYASYKAGNCIKRWADFLRTDSAVISQLGTFKLRSKIVTSLLSLQRE